MKEVWRPIKNYINKYEVSNLGRVRSLDRIQRQNGPYSPFERTYKGRILKLDETRTGYFLVSLYNDSRKKRNTSVHRLVLSAFKDNTEGKPCCNHKDGNKENNNIKNLEWCTYQENNKHAIDNNLNPIRYGEDSGHSKLTNKEVFKIKRLLSFGKKQKDIAKRFKISTPTISMIKNGHIWNWVND